MKTAKKSGNLHIKQLMVPSEGDTMGPHKKGSDLDLPGVGGGGVSKKSLTQSLGKSPFTRY